MNYLDTLKPEAEKALRSPAEKVRTLQKHAAMIQRRAIDEDDKGVRLVEDIARLEAAAGESLGGSTNDYEKFKVAIRKLQARLAASKEIGELFHKKIIPAQRRELDAARIALSAAAAVFYARHVPDCESRMVALLDAVVTEYDDFLDACAALRKEYGCGFPKTAPVVHHARLDSIGRRNTGSRWLTFTAQAPATRPLAAVCAVPEALQSTATGEIGQRSQRPRVEVRCRQRPP